MGTQTTQNTSPTSFGLCMLPCSVELHKKLFDQAIAFSRNVFKLLIFNRFLLFPFQDPLALPTRV